jgi:hypothetical protein
MRAAYSYTSAQNTIDPGSIAATSWTSNPIVNDPNNPALANSSFMAGPRFFIAPSYTHNFFKFGATTVGAFFDVSRACTITGCNTSYIFSGDMNHDGGSANDLIYIPKNTGEMNFQTFTVANGGPTFTGADQAAAFESYINQDDYLSTHRGQYAERGAVFFPFVKRLDLSIAQEVGKGGSGNRHSGEIRLDITNFGNLLNSSWGVSQSVIQNRILTNPGIDAQGSPTYRLATVGSGASAKLVSKTFQTNAAIADVYVMMLSFRYRFN